MQQKGQRRREKGVAAVHLGNAGEGGNKGKGGVESGRVAAAIFDLFFKFFISILNL